VVKHKDTGEYLHYILSISSETRKPYTVYEAYGMRRSLGQGKVVAPTT